MFGGCATRFDDGLALNVEAKGYSCGPFTWISAVPEDLDEKIEDCH